LSSGQYDAVLAQGLVGEKILSDNNIKNVEPVYIYENAGATKLKLNLEGYEQKFCFAVTEGDAELLSILNEGLVIVSANGTYDELFSKWFPFLIEKEKLSLVDTMQYIALIVLPILVILIIGYVITVRRGVRLKTAQIEKNNAANKIIVDAFSIEFSSAEERLDYVIKELVILSESMMGFIFSKSDSKEIVFKSCYSTIKDHKKDNIALYEAIKTKEIFIKSAQPNSHLLSNDYRSEYPNDELVLCNQNIERVLMLSIPSSEQVNIAVLLNRKTPFSEDNVNQTSILYRGLWSMIEKEEEKEKVEYMSFHDQLTGLYNRRFFEEQMIILDNPRNYPITIVMADVNNLKTVNDTFGHKVGDLLLQNVGELLSKHKRSNDIVTRWGGDEFVILMPKTSLENSKNLIERIQKDTFQMDNEYGKTSIAFGLATKETKDQQLASIFGEAEEHMYHNKQKRQIEQ